MLLYLTLAAVTIVVLVLVVYLIAIAFYLWRADQHLKQLVGGLQAVQGHVRPLPEHLTTINGALASLLTSLEGTDSHLAGAVNVFEGERGSHVL